LNDDLCGYLIFFTGPQFISGRDRSC
jgi:hypothetical protein